MRLRAGSAPKPTPAMRVKADRNKKYKKHEYICTDKD